MTRATISGAFLVRAILREANLEGANLEGANLEGANLEGAKLLYVNIFNTILSSANLSNAIILNIKYFDGLILNQDTDFADSIIDNKSFLELLQNNSCKNIPNVISNKKELEEKLNVKGFDRETIKFLISKSELPEN